MCFVRKTDSLPYLVDQCERKLEELKGIQQFGGDALNLQEYENTLTIPANTFDEKVWLLRMTATSPKFTMPLDFSIRPANSTTLLDEGITEPIRISDTEWGWYIFIDKTFYDNVNTYKLNVIYSGKATFALSVIK